MLVSQSSPSPVCEFNSSTCGALNFPREILLLIFKNLPPAIVAKLSTVNRAFCTIGRDQSLWKVFSRYYCPGTLATTPRGILREMHLREKKVQQTMALEAVYQKMVDKDPQLSVSVAMLEAWKNQYPCTTVLRIVSTQTNYREMLLRGHQRSWPHLSEFELVSEQGFFGIHTHDFIEFFSSHPGLRKVALRGLVNLTEQTLRTALSFCQNLEELDLEHDGLTDDFLSFLSTTFNLKSLKLSGPDQYTAAGHATLVNGFHSLTQAEIHVRNDTWANLDWIPFIASHRHLESFLLTSAAPTDGLLHALNEHLNSLKTLTLSDCNNISPQGLTALLSCTSLETISMTNCSQEVLSAIDHESYSPLRNKLFIQQI